MTKQARIERLSADDVRVVVADPGTTGYSWEAVPGPDVTLVSAARLPGRAMPGAESAKAFVVRTGSAEERHCLHLELRAPWAGEPADRMTVDLD